MKIDLNDEAINTLYRLGILKHTSVEHKEHHVFLVEIKDDLCLFECLNCDTLFESKLSIEK